MFNFSLTYPPTISNSRLFLGYITVRSQQDKFAMNLETLIASSCRRKIIRLLLHSGCTNVMQIVRKVNSTYNQVNSNLQILQKEGIVIDEHFGRTRVISLNRENPRTTLLLQALKILETPDTQSNKISRDQIRGA
jgi:predicted transcriptional regulator